MYWSIAHDTYCILDFKRIYIYMLIYCNQQYSRLFLIETGNKFLLFQSLTRPFLIYHSLFNIQITRGLVQKVGQYITTIP